MNAIFKALQENIWWIVTIVVLVAMLFVVTVARIARSKPDDDADFVAKIKTMLLSLTMAKFIKFLLEAACLGAIAASAYYLTTSQDKIVYIGLTTVIAIGVAFLVVFEGLPETWANGLLLGTASFACAAVFGLIFGIPPSISDKSSDEANPNGSLSAATAIFKTKDDALKSAQKALDDANKSADDAEKAQKSLGTSATSDQLQKAQAASADATHKLRDAESALKTAQAEQVVAKQEVDWWSEAPEALQDSLGVAKKQATQAKVALDSLEGATNRDNNAIDKASADYIDKRATAARIAQIADEGNRRKRALYGVNTNLTDISDWLTKIIVGVGLVQLSKIIGLLKSVSNYTAKGLASATATDSGPYAPVALTIILYFIAVGFLSAYLLTRVWLPQLLEGV